MPCLLAWVSGRSQQTISFDLCLKEKKPPFGLLSAHPSRPPARRLRTTEEGWMRPVFPPVSILHAPPAAPSSHQLTRNYRLQITDYLLHTQQPPTNTIYTHDLFCQRTTDPPQKSPLFLAAFLLLSVPFVAPPLANQLADLHLLYRLVLAMKNSPDSNVAPCT